MASTIAKLWRGSLEPIRHWGENNQEIKQLENLMQSNLERLERYLSEPAKEIFGKYNDCIEEYILVSCEQVFCDGFCLGTNIAMEALTGAEKIV